MGVQRTLIIILLLLVGLFAGCSNGADEGPTLPSPGGPTGGEYGGDQPEPPIPTPYRELAGQYICDMEWELDGDLVVSTGSGIFLFSPYGILKRTYPDVPCVYGLANNDTGRGMSYYGTATNCQTAGIDDDIYVSDGHATTVLGGDSTWYQGDPNLRPDICDITITMNWGCPGLGSPVGYRYHPHSGRTYIRLGASQWIGDDECEMDWHPDIGNVIDPAEICGTAQLTDVVLSFDQRAPFPPDIQFTGPPDEPNDIAGDWVVYVPNPHYNCLAALADLGFAGYVRMLNTARRISFNGTDPPA